MGTSVRWARERWAQALAYKPLLPPQLQEYKQPPLLPQPRTTDVRSCMLLEQHSIWMETQWHQR